MRFRKIKKIILKSGLFDKVYYLKWNRDVRLADITAIDHYCKIGIKEDRKPNKDFDPIWYRENYQDVKKEGVSPFIHYILHGQKENRRINPLAGEVENNDLSSSEINNYLFDEEFYLKKYQDVSESGMVPYSHYENHGEKEGRQPSLFCSIYHLKNQIDKDYSGTLLKYFYANERNKKLTVHPYFDIHYYLKHNEDVALSDVSPYFHFINTGVFEDRNPRKDIDIKEYCEKYNVNKKETNPFLHFISFFGEEYLQLKPESIHTQSSSSHDGKNYRTKGIDYEEPEYLDVHINPSKVKALAYYLPQFHPFKENDEWWGQGFTEWTNVTRGLSRFNGHYQPHLPKHLGYYDLRVKETISEQVRYAKAAGLYGFCFYHYWFNGKRLMEKPVNIFLENKDIDMPFCIMWTNENWTRAWDGLENDILLKQDYYDEDDVPFVKDLGQHFADDRYIRIEGRPLFFIYRPGIIPDAKKKIQKWRDLCKELLNEEPLFYMAQAFNNLDPNEFGMDGAIEFPPHKVSRGLSDTSRDKKGVFEGFEGFEGHYPSYDELVEKSISESDTTEFPLIRGVLPTWDNEARKPLKGMGFIGSTPKKYEKWLKKINNYAIKNPIAENESFVVINAWNEWAEGAHLEPDVYNGAAYLNATFRAMHNISSYKGKQKLILVGHDAYKHGAQLLTLHLFKTLRTKFGIDTTCILLDGGPLVDEYKAIGPVYVADGLIDNFKNIIMDINENEEFHHAICNTTVTGLCTKILSEQNIKSISLVHELSTLINEYSLQEHSENIAKYTEKVVFAAQFVKDSFEGIVGDLGDKAIVKPQGIYRSVDKVENARQKIREILGLDLNAKIVINAAFADLRKGFDLFIQTAKECIDKDSNYHFVWVGAIEPSMNNWILKQIQESEYSQNIHNVPFTKDLSLYLEGADVFAMTSREDPFPSVVLESLALGTPVVGFEGGGGFVDALEKECFGELVSMADCSALAMAIERQIQNNSEELRANRTDYVIDKYDWNDYVFSLVEYLIPNLKRVSVVVPNYNYAQYIEARLVSIFKQHYPIYEIIVLDDNSTDKSVDVIESVASIHNSDIDLIINKNNSGSVFKQWAKGIQQAKGEYLWIAEADDLADPKFLSTIMGHDSEFTMAYTDSKQIDDNDKPLANNYRYYYDKQMCDKLDKAATFDGKKVIESCLSSKNQFMNVSSVVFNKESINQCFKQYMDELLKFKVAGDWYVYVQMLKNKGAKCLLVGESLNVHRRHSNSVTKQNYSIQLNEVQNIHNLVRKYCKGNKIKNSQNEYLQEVSEVLKQGAK